MIKVLIATAALTGSVAFAHADCSMMKSVEVDTTLTVASIEPTPILMSTPQTMVAPEEVKVPAEPIKQ